MSRFTTELRVVPRAAWIVAALAYGCLSVPSFIFIAPTDRVIGTWPRWGQAVTVYVGFVLVAALVALIGYVYGDAKRRQMRYVMWTLLASCIPNGIGIILYFILRDPLPAPCPGCGHLEKAPFPYCPHCGTLRHPTCSKCDKPVEPAWSNCAYCGQPLGEATRTAAR
jgi:hypothetical protein